MKRSSYKGYLVWGSLFFPLIPSLPYAIHSIVFPMGVAVLARRVFAGVPRRHVAVASVLASLWLVYLLVSMNGSQTPGSVIAHAFVYLRWIVFFGMGFYVASKHPDVLFSTRFAAVVFMLSIVNWLLNLQDDILGTTNTTLSALGLCVLITSTHRRFTFAKALMCAACGGLIMVAYATGLTTSRGALMAVVVCLAALSLRASAVTAAIVLVFVVYTREEGMAAHFALALQQFDSLSGTAGDRYLLWGRILAAIETQWLGLGFAGYHALTTDTNIAITESFLFDLLSVAGLVGMLLVVWLIAAVLRGRSPQTHSLLPAVAGLSAAFLTNPIGFHPLVPGLLGAAIAFGRMSAAKPQIASYHA